MTAFDNNKIIDEIAIKFLIANGVEERSETSSAFGAIEALCDACESIYPIFPLMGTALSFAANDFRSKVQNLRQYVERDRHALEKCIVDDPLMSGEVFFDCLSPSDFSSDESQGDDDDMVDSSITDFACTIDIGVKIHRLNQVPLEPSTRITKLLNKGVSTLVTLDGKNYKSRTARTRLVIRVARGIGFIGTFLKKVGEGNLTIKQAAKEAYSTELRPYHSKLVRAAFSSVLPTLSSTRRQLHSELIKEKVTPCAGGSCNIVTSSSRMSLKADDEESFHQQMYCLGTLVLKSRDSITGALQSKGISTDW